MINKVYHKTEKEIVNELEEIQAAKNDPRKFEVLYNRYHEQIFRYVYSRVDNKHLASDITSQAFYKALLNIENYSFKGVPFASWLYRIAFNEMNMFFRNNAKERTVNIDDHGIESFFSELEDEEGNEREKEILANALSELPEDQLNLIEMRFFEGMSFKEVADIVGITENNAKVKVYRILDKLKKSFKLGA